MTTRKRNILLTILLLILSAIILATSVMFAEKNKTEAEAATSVSEIYIGSNVFNARNLHNIYTAIDSSATGLSSLSATTSGTSVASKNITVTFGGITWLATYLSKDDSSNTVLTLIENDVNSNQIPYSTSTATTNVACPSTMYGTSYIHAYLNGNGITSNTAGTSTTTSTNVDGTSNVYAKFNTIAGTTDKVTGFLVTPSAMSWQNSQAAPTASKGQESHYYNNEGLASFSGNYGSSTSFSGKTGYTSWGSDYVWLPSYTELKYLWALDNNSQIIVPDKETYFTRTAIDYSTVYIVTGGGFMSGSVNASSSGPKSYHTRACIHLNLTKADESATYVSQPGVSMMNASTYNGSAQGFTFLSFPSAGVTTSYTSGATFTTGGFTAVNAGTYTLTVTPDSTHMWSDGTTAGKNYSFTISKATYSSHSLTASGKTYDGTACSATKSTNGLPSGFTSTISYSGTLHNGSNYSSTVTAPTQAGSYTATLSFGGSNDNYEMPESKSVSFTIYQALYNSHTLRASGKTYDGTPYEAEVNTPNLPSGFTAHVEYSGVLENGDEYETTTAAPTEAGDYDVTLWFSGSDNNYVLPQSKEVSFPIEKATYTKHTLTASDKSYDGDACSAAYSTPDLPEGFTSSLTYTGTLSGGGNYSSTAAPIAAGSYTATLSFSGSNNNYELPATKTTNFTISKANYDVSGLSITAASNLTYDGNAKTATLNGSVTGVDGSPQVALYYIGTGSTSYNESTSAPVNAGTYKAYVKYTLSSNNYNAPTDNKAVTFTIAKADYDVSGLSITAASNLTYDGNAKTATASGAILPVHAGDSLPGYTVYYEGTNGTSYDKSTTAPQNAGEYKAYLQFSWGSAGENKNYNLPTDNKQITFTIAKADYNVGAIKLTVPDASHLVYDGLGKIVTVNSADLPHDADGNNSLKATVHYIDASGNDTTVAPVNAGTYSAYIAYSTTSTNYNTPNDTKNDAVSFTITPAQLKMISSADGVRTSNEAQNTINVTHFYDHSLEYDWKFLTSWFSTVASADKASIAIQYSLTDSGFMSENDFHLSLNTPSADKKQAETVYYIRVTATNHAEKIYKVTYIISQENVVIEFNGAAINASYGDDPSAQESGLWDKVISVTGLHKNDSDAMDLSEAIRLLKEVITLKIDATASSVAGKYGITFSFINNEGSAHYVIRLTNANEMYVVSEIEIGAGDINWGSSVADKKYPDQIYGDWRDADAHKKNHPAPEIAESALAAAEKDKLSNSREFIQLDYEIIDVKTSESIGTRKDNVHAHDAGSYKVRIKGFMNESAMAGKYKLTGVTLEMELNILPRKVTVTVKAPDQLKYGDKTLQEMKDYLTAHSAELYTFEAEGLISEAGITPVAEWSLGGSADGKGYLPVNTEGYTVTLTFKDGTDGNEFKLSNYNMAASYTAKWIVAAAEYNSAPVYDETHKQNESKYAGAIDKFRQQPSQVEKDPEKGATLVTIDDDLPEDLNVKYSYIDASGSDWSSAYTGLPTEIGVWKVRATFESTDPNYAAPEPVEITITIADHVHQFSDTEWSHDNDHHWHTPTCGHPDAKPQESEIYAHSYDGGKVDKEPTVTEKGVMRYTCTECGYYYTEDIPEHVHKFSATEWSHDNDHHWHTPTCGHPDAKPEESEIYAHNYDDGVQTRASTAAQAGEMKYTCQDCGYSYTREIPKHTYKSEWSHDETRHWHVCDDCDELVDAGEHTFVSSATKVATAAGGGETTYTCSTCGYSYTVTSTGTINPDTPNGGTSDSATPPATDGSENDKKKLGLIIGLSVGLGALALAAAVVAIVIALKRKAVNNVTLINPDEGGFYDEVNDEDVNGDGGDNGK